MVFYKSRQDLDIFFEILLSDPTTLLASNIDLFVFDHAVQCVGEVLQWEDQIRWNSLAISGHTSQHRDMFSTLIGVGDGKAASSFDDTKELVSCYQHCLIQVPYHGRFELLVQLLCEHILKPLLQRREVGIDRAINS